MTGRSLLVAALVGAFSAHAGVKIDIEMKRKGTTSKLNVQVDGKDSRMEMADASGTPEGAMIRDATRKRLMLINYKDKSYDEITEEQTAAQSAQLSQEMAKLKAQLEALPPQQRAQVEASMKQQLQMIKTLGSEEKYVRASGTKRIAGYSCDLYSVELDGKRIADTCLIPWRDLSFEGVQLKEALKAFEHPATAGMPGSMKAWGMDIGLPAWRRTVESEGEPATESTLISIRSASVPKSTFAAPAGFKKRH